MSYIIAGIPVRRIASNAFIAVISGLGCGKCWRNLEEHPGTGFDIIKYSTIGGCVGGVAGFGVGLWMGSRVMLLTLTQSMYGSLMTGTFLNIRSVMSNEKIMLPSNKKPFSELIVSTLSGGITGMIPPILAKWNPAYITSGCTSGIIIGFLGHLAYDQICYLRLEYLLRENYPELVRKHQEAEEYMLQRQKTEYFYTGPIKGNPEWMDYAKSFWGGFGKRSWVEENEK